MPAGIDKANVLFTSLDIPAPSRSNMQRLVNKASKSTIALNEEDMAAKRNAVVEHNRKMAVTIRST